MSKIFIEGNVGSGKTWIINLIKKQKFEKINIMEEPVNNWIDIGIFKKYYSNPERWGLTFQLFVIMTKLNRLSEISNKDINIIERSGYSDRYVFMNNMKNNGILNNMEVLIYDIIYETLMKKYEIDKNSKYIYIKTSPEKCLNRIKKRNREDEKEIDIFTIKNWHKMHEEILIPYFKQKKFKILIINNDNHKNMIHEKNILSKINSFIYNC
jgi:deoxyadenosine/deoxycytidine kinase